MQILYFLDETVLDLSWTDDGGHTLYALSYVEPLGHIM